MKIPVSNLYSLALLAGLSFMFCHSQKASKQNTSTEPVVAPQAPISPTAETAPAADSNWVNLATFAPEIKQDIKYATKDNFTKKQIYDCPSCLLRPEVATAVLAAHRALKKQGYGLLMKDCYRPGPYQQRLWDAVPDENYVAHPSKGSMHSRGVAVDLTLVDESGKELDMGTPYDFFGPEAHTAYTNLPEPILNRRRTLKKALEDQGFNAIKYEWWHYNYRQKEYPLSNYVWPCK
jgi:zinc D-Ala-D-Ala dipeptidase